MEFSDFLKAEAREIVKVTNAVIRSTARTLQRETKAEVGRNFKFKNSPGRAVKVYDLESGSRVALGGRYLTAFVEGKTIKARGNLIILLPDGDRLGFKRITRQNSWELIWQKIRTRSRLVAVEDGVVVIYALAGKNYPIYKFQKSVKSPKLLSIAQRAEDLADAIPDRINQLREKDYE